VLSNAARVRAPLILVLAVALLSPVIPAFAAGLGPEKVGGEPTRPLGPPDEGTQTTAARVIGVGRTYDGWLEIDAYGWRPPSDSSGERKKVCTWIEFEAEPAPTFGSCFGAGELEQPIAIESASELVQPKRLRSSYIGGSLARDVVRVALRIERPGNKTPDRVQATVAHVDGPLQGKLKQSEPFGYFFAKVRGLVPAKDIHATAYDADGRKVGSTRGLSAQGV
jgi:hypothetical protein